MLRRVGVAAVVAVLRLKASRLASELVGPMGARVRTSAGPPRSVRTRRAS
ncbi:MAG: hypothetical protein JWO31_649 [Phycisphaerales bacterium]|nr:hypothetical protein [Phycisphaerales bacterium]